MNNFLIVDGNSILNRAFYGVRPLTTRDGRNTNAIFGFINMLAKQLEAFAPAYAAMAFDLKAPTFRHKAFDYYKANRHGMPPELAEQLPVAKEIAALLGFPVVTLEGYEADDILGTLSTLASGDTTAYIMTGDRDSYQLVTECAKVLYVSTKDTSVFDTARVAETYGGLSPEKLIDVKALMGDTSDNIPGVPGVGEKTAVDLIVRYGSLENVYAALESGDPSLKGALRTKLENGKQSALDSRFLATICKTAPVGKTLDDLVYTGMDKPKLREICEDLELRSIVTRLGLDSVPATGGETLPLFEQETKTLAVTDIDPAALPAGRLFAFLDEESGMLYACGETSDEVVRFKADKTALETVFSRETVLHNFKEWCLYAARFDVFPETCAFDVLLASYVADPAKVVNADGLASLAGIGGVDTSDPVSRAVASSLGVKKGYALFAPVIEADGSRELLYDVEMPVSAVLADMERTGFKINVDKVRAFAAELDERLEARKAIIYDYADGEFNINSTKQLAEVLFERLHLPAAKKTKSGYSTDAETLEKLRAFHPIIDEILEYRAVSKLRGTYTDSLIDCADENGRIHTNFKQAYTLTGRLSSAEPNLQNIPIRTSEGRELRKFFEACDEEHILIDADYSQIELRLMAAMSGDENMIEAYREGRDIHTSTAASVFGVPEEAVTPELRKKAKAVNFGIIYGISDFSLAGDIHVSRKEAAAYIAAYFAGFPRVKAYLDAAVQTAHEKGYSETLFHRRRYIPELAAKKKPLVAFGERVAMNAPIQGTAADIIKIAMLRVWRRLKAENLDARLVLQVHDELIVEASKADAEKAKTVLCEEMQNAVNLAVPLVAAAGEGFTWFEAHE